MRILITLHKNTNELHARALANGIDQTVKKTLRGSTRIRAVDLWILVYAGGMKQADSTTGELTRPDAYELQDPWAMQVLLHGVLNNLIRYAMHNWNNYRRK